MIEGRQCINVIVATLSTGSSVQRRSSAYSPDVTRPRVATGPLIPSQARPQPAISRRDKAAKPIIDWIARKLGASKRVIAEPTAQNARQHASSSARPVVSAAPQAGSSQATPKPPTTRTRSSRRSSSPQAAYSFVTNSASRAESHSLRSLDGSPSHCHPYLSNLYSLDNDADRDSRRTSGSPSMHSHTSLASFSARNRDDGSFFSNSRADEDASLRPMAPSRPVSYAPSSTPIELSQLEADAPSAPAFSPPSDLADAVQSQRFSDSSSVVSSDAPSRAGVSGASSTSTKPTTLMSIDMRPPAAHIAQAPPALGIQPPPFEPLPPSSRISDLSTLGSASRPTSQHETSLERNPIRDSYRSGESSVPPPISHVTRMQAPKRSTPHPRDNPRPSSPPRANASMVTLASSTFAMSPATPTPSQGPSMRLSPQSRHAYRIPGHTGTPSVTWADPSDNVSTFGEPSARSLAGDQYSNYVLSHLTGSFGARRRSFDDDASDRAVRRRGSWESGESGWSWRGPKAPGSSDGPRSIGGGRASLSISLRSKGYDHEPRVSASPFVLGSQI